MQSTRQRAIAGGVTLAQPLAAYLAQRWLGDEGRLLAWLLVAAFFVSAPFVFKRSGEDLDRYTDSVAAAGKQPSRARLLELALFSLSIIAAGALMLLVVDALVTAGTGANHP